MFTPNDLPKPMKYISHGKQPLNQNCNFKENQLGLQQIIEGFPEYFDHLRGDCACGKCICGNCKCEISKLPKQMPNLNPSHYQQNYGPKCNKYMNGQLNRNLANPPAQSTHQKPLDYQTTTQTSYLRPGPTHLEFIKRKKQFPEDQELIGHSNYQENYKNWGNNKSGPILPCNSTEVLNKVPFAGMSNYDENYNKKHGLEKDPAIAKIIEKCKIPMFKSPINPADFPFIGQSTNQRNFHPYAPYDNKYSRMNIQPTQLPSTLWKTTHARDFGDKGDIECPGRAYVKRSMLKKRNYF